MPPCVWTDLNVWIPPYVWMPQYVDTPICLDALLVWTPPMFGCPHMFEHPALCLGDVWMPPVHTQHMELCYVTLRGCPYTPIHLDAPICVDAPPYVWMHPLYVWIPPHVWMAPCLSECPHMFGHPLYGCPHVSTPPICLDTPHMFEHPALCLGDVWMSPVHTQKIESCYVTLRGCPYTPIHLDAPICVDVPCIF